MNRQTLCHYLHIPPDDAALIVALMENKLNPKQVHRIECKLNPIDDILFAISVVLNSNELISKGYFTLINRGKNVYTLCFDHLGGHFLFVKPNFLNIV